MTDKLSWRYANTTDIPLLSDWNRALQEDEGSEPMSLDNLSTRFNRWLDADFSAVIFEIKSKAVGYVLYRDTDPDLKFPNGIYLRHYYFVSSVRGKGIGTQAFNLLLAEIFPKSKTIVLEALFSNPAGQKFWSKLGFGEYSITYERHPDASK